MGIGQDHSGIKNTQLTLSDMVRFFAVVFVVSLMVGCSSRPATTATNVAAKQTSNPSVDPGTNSSPNSNTESPPNSNRTLTRAEMMEKYRQKSLVNAPSSGPLPTPQFHPAPENSAIATTMNKDGAVVETRVFKSDPQLAKVEMTWVGPQNSTLKIFLKNGRIVETRSENIQNLGTTPVSVFLEIAGMRAAR